MKAYFDDTFPIARSAGCHCARISVLVVGCLVAASRLTGGCDSQIPPQPGLGCRPGHGDDPPLALQKRSGGCMSHWGLVRLGSSHPSSSSSAVKCLQEDRVTKSLSLTARHQGLVTTPWSLPSAGRVRVAEAVLVPRQPTPEVHRLVVPAHGSAGGDVAEDGRGGKSAGPAASVRGGAPCKFSMARFASVNPCVAFLSGWLI